MIMIKIMVFTIHGTFHNFEIRFTSLMNFYLLHPSFNSILKVGLDLMDRRPLKIELN